MFLSYLPIDLWVHSAGFSFVDQCINIYMCVFCNIGQHCCLTAGMYSVQSHHLARAFLCGVYMFSPCLCGFLLQLPPTVQRRAVSEVRLIDDSKYPSVWIWVQMAVCLPVLALQQTGDRSRVYPASHLMAAGIGLWDDGGMAGCSTLNFMVVGLNISETAVLLWFSHTRKSRVYREWYKKQKTSSDHRLRRIVKLL